MPNGLPYAADPVLIIDDVESEAMTLDLLCRSLGVATVRAANAAEPAAILASFLARAGVPIKPASGNLH